MSNKLLRRSTSGLKIIGIEGEGGLVGVYLNERGGCEISLISAHQQRFVGFMCIRPGVGIACIFVFLHVISNIPHEKAVLWFLRERTLLLVTKTR